jgi:putative peptidoglycan lipid II flippase
MWGSACNLIINVILNYLFTKWIGVSGVALSTSCVYIFSFLFLFFHIKEKLKRTKTDFIDP